MLYIILMCISCLFFVNDLLLFILYLFWTMEMMLDKKQILAIFLFEFKMGYKAVETTCNISNTFSSGTTNEHTVHWQCRKFCKNTKALKMRGVMASYWTLTMNNWEQTSELICLQLHEKFAEELNICHSMVILHLKQIGKVKKAR